MCDYSLEHQKSRPAAAGDRLVVTSFRGSPTHGFSAVGGADVAVCLRPGTELAFDAPVALRGFFRFLLDHRPQTGFTARFRHVNEGNPLLHHDALEFGNGQTVLLTSLRAGQLATVIQLPAEARTSTPAPAAAKAR
jgi:hypothetical protein